MMEESRQVSCADVEDRMAEILDGSAPDPFFEHVADCDRCRDARYDAEKHAALVASAGADYVPPADLEARVLAALDRQGGAPATGAPTPVTSTPDASTPAGSAAPADPAPAALPAVEAPRAVTATLPSTPPRDSVAAVAEAAPAAAKTEPTPVATPSAPARTDGAAARTEPSPMTEPVDARPRAVELGRKPGARRWLLVGGVGAALAAAAAATLVVKQRGGRGAGSEVAAEAWHGNVAKLSGAGLSVCAPDGKSCTTAADQGAVPAGSVLVTDGHTRARVTLADGTELSLDRDTRVALGAERGRRARLERGTLVADVAHVEGKTARVDLPRGHVEVLGTKFSLTASEDSATVNVSRGTVKLADAEGREVTVRAGEQGRSYAGMPPFVSAATTLGESIAWSEADIAEGEHEEVAVRGLGELKAKKPGDATERDNAVTLTAHSVKVRIAGAMARTEVDETFTNNTDEVLEGIYRFPVPPDAKIERLALEVDGKLEEGAFVDRDRAAAIWRGAIVNAAPQIRQQVREEIVWVPGPWRDPALLEWQRGGRFELRIYPIPKRGARRVILAYTQTITPTGGVRRYSYPLPHDPSGTTRVGRFDVDVQVRGHDESFGVRAQGYDMTRAKQNGADQLTLTASSFSPSGDLTIEYALPDRDAELTAWAYKPTSEEASRLKQKAEPKPLPGSKGGDGGRPKAAPVAAPKLGDDAPYVALALRPKLPRAREDGQRTFAIVVDSSRSMFGESYRRAVNVAAKLVRELDRGDSFTLLACDTDCRVLPGGLQIPGRQSALEARRFLESIVPEGASDPTLAIRAARAAAGAATNGQLRVVYIGDGMPTAGAVRPAHVTRAVEEALPPGTGTVTTVAIGADSDSDTLGAMARGGGGVLLPFVPGQTTAEAVFATLGATYGTTLRDVTVELPAGLTEVAPRRVDTFVAGGEQLLVARMERPDIEGTVVVRGKLGKEGFEQRYPIRITATDARGNAFVPRLFAATRIADLEREPGAEAKKEAIRLSSAFDVASRFTSLLVLESEAMFKAFGLDNTRTAHQWTGEEAAAGTVARGAKELEEPEDDAFDKNSAARGRAGPAQLDALPEGETSAAAPGFAPSSGAPPRAAAKPASPPAAGAPPAEPLPFASDKKKSAEIAADEKPRQTRPPPMPPWSSRRRMIPMRRIWERKGSVIEGRVTAKAASSSAIAQAERDLQANANHRGALRKLFTLYAIAGDVEQARGLAERWSEKEPLDPEALTARADIAARSGDRDGAIRILGSVVDVRPDDVPSQKRLARLHRWAGRPAVGCRHSLALAQLRAGDPTLLAEAVSCGRRTGEGRLADDLLGAAEPGVRQAAEAQLARFDNPKDELSGDLRLEAQWFGGDADLDLALIDPDGNRVSWLGAPTRAVITAQDVTSTQREGLALRGAKPGEYVIEIVRGSGSGPVRGEVVVNVAGTRRVVPFFLNGVRESVGIAKISMESRLVPVSGGWVGPWD